MTAGSGRITTLVLSIGLIGLFALARPAAAQCVPDVGTGTSSVPTCDNEHGGSNTSSLMIFHWPAREFLQNPIVATVTWIASRRPGGTSAQGQTVWVRQRYALRDGRTPKQVAW